MFKELCQSGEDALVVKLLVKTLGYNIMRDILKRLRRLSRGFDIMDVDNGFFMVKFDLP